MTEPGQPRIIPESAEDEVEIRWNDWRRWAGRLFVPPPEEPVGDSPT